MLDAYEPWITVKLANTEQTIHCVFNSFLFIFLVLFLRLLARGTLKYELTGTSILIFETPFLERYFLNKRQKYTKNEFTNNKSDIVFHKRDIVTIWGKFNSRFEPRL